MNRMATSAPVSSQALRSPNLPQNPLAVLQNRRIRRRRAAASAFVSAPSMSPIACTANGIGHTHGLLPRLRSWPAGETNDHPLMEFHAAPEFYSADLPHCSEPLGH